MAFGFKLFDIDITVTWGFIALLAFFILMTGSPVLVAIVTFALLGHELSHMFAARRLGYKSDKMTLWFLGGLAYIDKKFDDDDKDSFLISIAGPAFNFAMLLLALAVATLIQPQPDSALYDFAGVNLVLGVFNLLPAYPMDGGRILKSILGMLKLQKTTVMNITHTASVIFGFLFIGIGLSIPSVMLILIGGWLMLNVWAERNRD